MASLRTFGQVSPRMQQQPYDGPVDDLPNEPDAPAPAPDVILRGSGAPTAGESGRSQQTPRERQDVINSNINSIRPAPDRPDEPTPMAGSSFQPPQGVVPFQPLRGPAPVQLAKPQGVNGLLGGAGGLTGGGLGVPFDPINTASSDPISTLIQLLMSQHG